MPFNQSSNLWSNDREHFYHDRDFMPLMQVGPHCVSTTLAILTNVRPEEFQGQINTQDPISWSQELKKYGMKLAYCPTDTRRLKFYMPELLELDDLFTIGYYTPANSNMILNDPSSDGWICGSHIAIVHRNFIIDPASGTKSLAQNHSCNERYTKRIFRVIPTNHERGL
jgi:hypothetical protein